MTHKPCFYIFGLEHLGKLQTGDLAMHFIKGRKDAHALLLIDGRPQYSQALLVSFMPNYTLSVFEVSGTSQADPLVLVHEPDAIYEAKEGYIWVPDALSALFDNASRLVLQNQSAIDLATPHDVLIIFDVQSHAAPADIDTLEVYLSTTDTSFYTMVFVTGVHDEDGASSVTVNTERHLVSAGTGFLLPTDTAFIKKNLMKSKLTRCVLFAIRKQRWVDSLRSEILKGASSTASTASHTDHITTRYHTRMASDLSKHQQRDHLQKLKPNEPNTSIETRRTALGNITNLPHAPPAPPASLTQHEEDKQLLLKKLKRLSKEAKREKELRNSLATSAAPRRSDASHLLLDDLIISPTTKSLLQISETYAKSKSDSHDHFFTPPKTTRDPLVEHEVKISTSIERRFMNKTGWVERFVTHQSPHSRNSMSMASSGQDSWHLSGDDVKMCHYRYNFLMVTGEEFALDTLSSAVLAYNSWYSLGRSVPEKVRKWLPTLADMIHLFDKDEHEP